MSENLERRIQQEKNKAKKEVELHRTATFLTTAISLVATIGAVSIAPGISKAYSLVYGMATIVVGLNYALYLTANKDSPWPFNRRYKKLEQMLSNNFKNTNS